MDSVNDNGSSFALTAHSNGEPGKLYTPIAIMNIDKVIVVEANAMWDTGAEVCLISRRLAECLQLEMAPGPIARGLTGSAETSVCYVYVSLVANGGVITVKCMVVDDHIGGLDYSMIIGMNLIRRGSLAITGGEYGITLSFTMPATDTIDFMVVANHLPGAVVPLSDGREELKIYTGINAVKIMRRALPDNKN